MISWIIDPLTLKFQLIFFCFFRTLGRAWKHLKTKLQDEANAHQAFASKVTQRSSYLATCGKIIMITYFDSISSNNQPHCLNINDQSFRKICVQYGCLNTKCKLIVETEKSVNYRNHIWVQSLLNNPDQYFILPLQCSISILYFAFASSIPILYFMISVG